ncbi:hypothetical protein [Paenibacillus glucanolyticus]|uniref:hypothetical protein n=1 Tax=Paenibacillus glucanolyticus TaxID=59843 RepID=UPI00096BED9A|nr:hypothetical protein [Paenibacillus glucanolyticus]OMF68473.1 hypothetical protein BK142_27285 [Paenibacillus glucanolyticus]
MNRIGIAFLIVFFLLAGCNQVSDAPISNSTNMESDTGKHPVQYTLSFKDVDLEKPLKKMVETDLTKIILKQEINEYTTYFYQKNQDDENITAAIKIGGNIFEIGHVGYSAQNTDQYTVSLVKALDKNYIKITGACGANCPISYYIQTDTNSPKVLGIEAHTVETDIEQDGTNEIVATVGTAAQTSIYKIKNAHIVATNLNETLEAQEVTYDKESNTFVSGVKIWRVKGEELVSSK